MPRDRDDYFLWSKYFRIDTISSAKVSKTMNSSYVLIKNALLPCKLGTIAHPYQLPCETYYGQHCVFRLIKAPIRQILLAYAKRVCYILIKGKAIEAATRYRSYLIA